MHDDIKESLNLRDGTLDEIMGLQDQWLSDEEDIAAATGLTPQQIAMYVGVDPRNMGSWWDSGSQDDRQQLLMSGREYASRMGGHLTAAKFLDGMLLAHAFADLDADLIPWMLLGWGRGLEGMPDEPEFTLDPEPAEYDPDSGEPEVGFELAEPEGRTDPPSSDISYDYIIHSLKQDPDWEYRHYPGSRIEHYFIYQATPTSGEVIIRADGTWKLWWDDNYPPKEGEDPNSLYTSLVDTGYLKR